VELFTKGTRQIESFVAKSTFPSKKIEARSTQDMWVGGWVVM
jgi:hypothetical protein